jgi:CheY-like chemotaxis protein
MEAIMKQMDMQDDKTRIMVVDDEATVCRSVAKILDRKGCQVTEALSVAAALEILEKDEGYDLIIVDLMMPQTGGVELLKIVKETRPKIPILIITGFASIASAVETTKLGAVGYLPKPFTPEELAQAVESVLAGAAVTAAEDAGAFPPSSFIDVDLPFDSRELAQATSQSYVEHLTRSGVRQCPRAIRHAGGRILAGCHGGRRGAQGPGCG